jgi:hypothetical protein
MYECNPTAVFDDNNLPDDLCDNIYQQISECTINVASGWAVGGDDVSFRNESSTCKKSCSNRSWNFQKLVDIQ